MVAFEYGTGGEALGFVSKPTQCILGNLSHANVCDLESCWLDVSPL